MSGHFVKNGNLVLALFPLSKMSKVLIVVEASGKGIVESPTTLRMVSALKQAIITSVAPTLTVQVIEANMPHKITGADLQLDTSSVQDWTAKHVFVCPLTLNLSPTLPFPAKAVYQACLDVIGLRQRLAQHSEFAIADGSFWLPIVLTAKGPLYGEVIGLAGQVTGGKLPDDLSLCDLDYYQPFHLSDASRQQVYSMGQCLLQLLSPPPGTYLVQFGFQGSDICFDRLWPFPSAPAIASLGVQEPDLFACHWYCLTTMPVLDLTIIPAVVDQA